VERSDLELKITLDDNCKRLEYCSINSEWDGVCKLKNAYLDPLRLYPGDPCSPGKYDSTCFFGLQKCNWNNKCLGSRLGGECSSSADCNPEQYCELGRCTETKKLGSVCYHRNECGRIATCWFSDPNLVSGLCQEYFKIDNNSPVNVSMKIDSYSVINDDSHLLCRSQYADSKGVCQAGLRSKNKGKPCN